jgi:hypothetical protein
MKKIIIAILAVFTFAACQPAVADTIRTADGISCSFDADDSPYEVETYIESGSDDYNNNYNDGYSNTDRDDHKVGVKLTYKFGGPKRLNCDTLYQLELRDKSAKVKQLEAKIKMLEAAQDIKW